MYSIKIELFKNYSSLLIIEKEKESSNNNILLILSYVMFLFNGFAYYKNWLGCIIIKVGSRVVRIV